MNIQDYLKSLNSHFKRGIATEYTFRGDLQQLLESLVSQVKATNEPRRIGCGAPDYVITHKDIPIGYIEAKDIDTDLKAKQYREQFDRYRNALDNLIITDYLTFDLYKEGEFVTSVQIGEVRNNEILSLDHNFDKFTQLVQDFCHYEGQTIKSAKRLAELMAAKARLLAMSLRNAIEQDEKEKKTSELSAQLDAFRRVLIDTLTPKEFADIYAQTIAYGMFAARLHDKTLRTFSRMEAASLIPHSNPFLRKMFQKIATFDLDTRIAWIVNALADVFKHTDVTAILKNFGKSTQQHDPIIHFYETFLAEYDPKLRKSRGVWYTPEPVVNFIVRAVDDILKSDFGIDDGLASRETVQVERAIDQSYDRRTKDGTKKRLKTYHKVQILDPATGTGTFLVEVIKQIYPRFQDNKGMWNGYVKEHLIPRLNGFELLMASYAMAHLKMDLLLEETDYKAQDEQRFNIFLTNSLEESHPDMGTLFASWLSDEANAANRVKCDTPVMCVIGNPPYNSKSKNKGSWITEILSIYKENLGERNTVPLDNDYVKFIRLGEYFVEKNETGILAYISANSFLDGVTHRVMRNNLLKTFDHIYIINLHGNSIKGTSNNDTNIFDITVGVSINIFVKTNQKQKNQLGKVSYIDLKGSRNGKYEFLFSNSLSTINWDKLSVEKDIPWKSIGSTNDKRYYSYMEIDKVFLKSTPCIRTHNDKELISFQKFDSVDCNKYLFKVFDVRYINFDLSKIGRPRIKVMREFLGHKNVGLIFQRGASGDIPNTPFISRFLSDQGAVRPGTTSTSNIAPLYLYPDPDKPDAFQGEERIPNLDMEIVGQIEKKLKLAFIPEENIVVDLAKGYKGTFAPIHLLDYIYAVLHSPHYRETYKEFLKTDFPRVPYPKDVDKFWKLVELGKQIRELHLMDKKGTANVTYPNEGSNIVTRSIVQKDFELTDKDKQTGRVWINEEQYFDHVPVTAWEFYIGGYQPAQKWLKDRKDRELSFDDIEHYQNIIYALMETDWLMKEIDKVGVI